MTNNNRGRATEHALDMLHNLTAQAMLDELDRQQLAGEVSPQLLATITRFLTANKIDAPATSKRMENLDDKLAALNVDLDDEILGGKHTGNARH